MAVLKFIKKKKVKKKAKVKSKAKRKITRRKTTIRKRKVTKRKITRVIKKKKPSLKIRTKKALKITKLAVAKKIVAPNEEFVGMVTHYFPKVKAAVVKVSKGELALGDKIHIKGHTTDFTQEINSMQIEHVSIDRAKKGDEIGLRVKSRIRIHDNICKLL